jgi:hypothetical protein
MADYSLHLVLSDRCGKDSCDVDLSSLQYNQPSAIDPLLFFDKAQLLKCAGF